MAMTDEQMKDLIKFARIDVPERTDYGALMSFYTIETIIKIYATLEPKVLELCNASQYISPIDQYKFSLELLHRWLNSDAYTKKVLRQAIETCGSHLRQHVNKNHYNHYTIVIMIMTLVTALEAISWKDSVHGTKDAANVLDDLANMPCDVKILVVKEILHYYGEDYKTFEALYL